VAGRTATVASKVDRSRKLLGNFQVIEPFSLGIWIKPSLKALPMHLRRAGLFPLTSTGEHPSPTKGRIAFR
jgi:hypothetical protein